MTIRINLIFITFFSFLFAQTPDDLKKFIETYDKIKVDQEANEIVKKGIESEKGPEEGPVRLLVKPSDISKYYNEKLNVIREDLSTLNNLLSITDTIFPIRDFGYNYFSTRDSIPFIDNILIDNNYVLGFGDELTISVWGEVQQYETKYIQRDGTIYIDNVGLLYVGGKSLNDVKNYIFNRFSKVYSTLLTEPKRSFIDVSVSNLKNINVFVSGHVKYPGNYVVNPSMSVNNLLILAGGITETGSLRKIYLNRNNTIIDSLDLYPLISGLNYSNDIKFKDKDILIVSPKGPSVSVTGSVRIPAYYEIKNDSIHSLISYAGGFDRNAKESVYIYRDNAPNLLLNSEKFTDVKLSNGDSLIFPYKHLTPKFISISIDNRKPLKIPWVENMTYDEIFEISNIKKLNIKKIELVRKINGDFFENYDLQNYDNGDFIFLPFDYMSIQLINDYVDLNTITIKGNVNAPGVYPLVGNNESLNSVILRAGGILEPSSIENVIVKRDTFKLGSYNGNLILSPNDTVFVEGFNGVIKMEGEIHNPGMIEWQNERLAKDYIFLAGGLTSYGDKRHIIYLTPYGEAIKISKNSKLNLLPGSKIIVKQKPSYELSNRPDRFQQFSSVISSIVTIALLARTTSN